jgi:hypothetical protein
LGAGAAIAATGAKASETAIKTANIALAMRMNPLVNARPAIGASR